MIVNFIDAILEAAPQKRVTILFAQMSSRSTTIKPPLASEGRMTIAPQTRFMKQCSGMEAGF